MDLNDFSMHVKVLRFLGLLAPINPSIVHYFHVSILFYLFTILFLSSLFTSVLFISSMKQVVDNLIVTTSSISAFLRGIIFYMNSKERIAMFKVMKELNDEISSKKNGLETNIMYNVHRRARILFRIFLTCYCLAIGFLWIQSFYGKRNEIFWSSTTLYPNGINEIQSLYWILYLIQGIGTTMMTILSCILDSYQFMLLIILNGHTDVLVHRLETIGNKLTQQANPNLKNHVKQFYSYLGLVELVKSCLSSAFFVQFGISGVVFCTCAFQLSVTNFSEFPTITFIILYFICVIIQLFVPCYYATLLFHKSNNLTNALFHSNWLKQNLSFKRMMIIFLQAVHRPISIVAGHMFTLNLTTFLSIARLAYSLYALL